jgi:hypothetical protein
LDLLLLFRKLDKTFVRKKLYGLLSSIRADQNKWVDDFEREMYDKSREELKHIYTKSFNRVLQQSSAFKWRLRQLSTDYVKN